MIRLYMSVLSDLQSSVKKTFLEQILRSHQTWIREKINGQVRAIDTIIDIIIFTYSLQTNTDIPFYSDDGNE